MITVGVDEVGRGCWAGPVVAGAVVLKNPIKDLRDSKKVPKKEREKLAAQIQIEAAAIGLGWVTPIEVDSLGLTEAVRLAMKRALEEIKLPYDKIIIDGNYNFFPKNPKAQAIIKADDSEPCVSAASIIAKVARDKFMIEQAVLFPNYGFDKHVGYGTKLHIESLRQLGICELHRKSYKPIQSLLTASS